MGLFSYIDDKYQYLKRYNEIIGVLVKYGFEDMVSYMETEKKYKWLKKFVPKSTYKDAINLTRWEKMRLVCEELGPTYVKFGQILSSRIDLMPPELVLELEKLQDRVPPESGEVAKQLVEKELGGKIEDLFASFEYEAFASASLAQVHRATLKTGESVVLKIQRPEIQTKIKSDIKVMLYVAEVLLRRMPTIASIDPVGLVHHFEKSIMRELDFIRESINVQRFRGDFSKTEGDRKYIHSPLVYQEFTTSKVLTLEYIDGIKISDFHKLETQGYNRKTIAKRLAVSYFKQVFNNGFFHADPHPGNLMVLPDNVVCYLDYGMMGNIMPKDLEQLGHMFISVRSMDVGRIIRSLLSLSELTTIKNYRDLEEDIHEFVHSFSIQTTHQNELSTILMDLKDIVVRHGIKVPSHFFLLARSMVSFEGVVRNLNPEIDLEKIIRPYLLKTVAKNFDPINMGKKVFNTIGEFGAYMEEFPRDLKNAIRKINTGEIKVDMTHKGIDPFIHTVNRISKRIIQAVVLSGLIIGGSIMIVSKVSPMWGETSAPGLVGLIIAGIIGLFMIRDVSKGDHDDWKGWEGWDDKNY